MSELLRQTPPVASDVVGAVSALAAFHSLNLLFAPVGCLAAVRAALDGFYFKNPLYAAQMEELDAVMGMEGHFLVWAGRLIRRHPEIEFVALIGAPIPTVSGVNLKRIAVRLERDYGLPVLCIEATGFGSCYWGMHLVWDTLGKRFLKKTPGEQDGSVNILGASRFILGDDWGLAEIKSALGQCGISLECVFEQCGTLSALSNSTKASCNLVMSHESLGIAQYMWEVFNIPYIVRFPAGRHGMRCLLMELSQHIDCAVPRSLLELYEIPWDRKDGRKIIVGTAPAVSAGLQNCLREDFGIQQVAALGIAPEERRISMRYHPYFEELSFTESFTQMKEIFSQYELIISDPILQAAAGSAQFLPLTYAPLSGKQYIDARQSLLGLSGDAWLAAMLETEV